MDQHVVAGPAAGPGLRIVFLCFAREEEHVCVLVVLAHLLPRGFRTPLIVVVRPLTMGLVPRIGRVMSPSNVAYVVAHRIQIVLGAVLLGAAHVRGQVHVALLHPHPRVVLAVVHAS